MAKKSSPSLIADNRKARHDFHIHETYEAGIALTGTEIKSIRQGKLNLKDSFCRIDKGEILLYGVHISLRQFKSKHVKIINNSFR